MQRLLAGVARYLEGPETWVLPVGIASSEALFPVGEESLKPVQVVTRIGRPIPAAVLRERANGDRRLLMDCIGLAIAELLPPGYRGAYADHVTDLGDARVLRAAIG